ncbi:MAG: hypothetical protein H7Y39_16635 [Nitrospiraceae bacterium]|nr:hypothetical protein [Nitrospiraceae bacterium]
MLDARHAVAFIRGGHSRVTSWILPSDEQLAKTGTFDAQTLARFAEGIHPTLRVIPDAQTQELAGPAARRLQGLGAHRPLPWA